ncbi:hypothetical protein [Embleya sp. NPDC059237]|uniref:hypothetical protein n=1 Tax=Embleya sp. NPDC059237 TaxID=3346784 RepID=UPI003689196A
MRGQPMTHDEDVTITSTEAGHVVWFYRPPGLKPGPFAQGLITLIDMAGYENRRRLAAAFPGYAAAVHLARNDPKGIAKLERIAFGRHTGEFSNADGGPTGLDEFLDTAARFVDDEIERLRTRDRTTIQDRIAQARTNYNQARTGLLGSAGRDA